MRGFDRGAGGIGRRKEGVSYVVSEATNQTQIDMVIQVAVT